MAEETKVTELKDELGDQEVPLSIKTELDQWQAPIEFATRFLLFLFGLSYFIGFIIVNSSSRFNSSGSSDLFRVEYISAGLLWLFIFASAVSAIAFCRTALRTVKASVSREAGKLKWLLILVLYFLVAAFSFLGVATIFSILSSGRIAIFSGTAAVLILALIFSALVVHEIYFDLASHLPNEKSVGSSKRQASPLGIEWPQIFIRFSLLLTLISGFGFIFYPRFSPQFGGGAPKVVRMAVKADSIMLVNRLGLSIDHDTQLSEPVRILNDTDDYYVIKKVLEVDDPFGAELKLPTITLKRDLIEATVTAIEGRP